MNIQQLEYIIAVNNYRHFVSASEHCNITQPTLSLMIQKLETELGVSIFDRSKHPIEPTLIGKKIIAQAEQTIREMKKIQEIITLETNSLSGPLHIGIIPTLSSYIVPKFIQAFTLANPQIDLTISEMQTSVLIPALATEKIDVMIAATPLDVPDFYEIPVYYEPFVAYFSNIHDVENKTLSAENMPNKDLWLLQEGHCLRNQIFNFCKKDQTHNQTFEAGSIDTLIKIVDTNGGYSVIPELHLEYLSAKQLEKTVTISNPPAVREISLIIKKDFIKEKMINSIANTIKEIIPEHMLDNRLKKFAIKL